MNDRTKHFYQNLLIAIVISCGAFITYKFIIDAHKESELEITRIQQEQQLIDNFIAETTVTYHLKMDPEQVVRRKERMKKK